MLNPFIERKISDVLKEFRVKWSMQIVHVGIYPIKVVRGHYKWKQVRNVKSICRKKNFAYIERIQSQMVNADTVHVGIYPIKDVRGHYKRQHVNKIVSIYNLININELHLPRNS